MRLDKMTKEKIVDRAETQKISLEALECLEVEEMRKNRKTKMEVE